MDSVLAPDVGIERRSHPYLWQWAVFWYLCCEVFIGLRGIGSLVGDYLGELHQSLTVWCVRSILQWSEPITSGVKILRTARWYYGICVLVWLYRPFLLRALVYVAGNVPLFICAVLTCITAYRRTSWIFGLLRVGVWWLLEVKSTCLLWIKFYLKQALFVLFGVRFLSPSPWAASAIRDLDAGAGALGPAPAAGESANGTPVPEDFNTNPRFGRFVVGIARRLKAEGLGSFGVDTADTRRQTLERAVRMMKDWGVRPSDIANQAPVAVVLAFTPSKGEIRALQLEATAEVVYRKRKAAATFVDTRSWWSGGALPPERDA